MYELSLFSGAGGGLLATKHLLGWTTIGYVEIDEYCQKVLIQRIKDGHLDPAPIFGDIRQFISEGYAEAYQGVVDVITAGFPCQPFSVAGKQQGEDDPRNMWPSTIDAIHIIRPRLVLLENVPGLSAVHTQTLYTGLLRNGQRARVGEWYDRDMFEAIQIKLPSYVGRVFGDLAEAGYDARWCVLGADDVGAPHRRKRLWVVAYAASNIRRTSRHDEPHAFDRPSAIVAHTKGL